MDGRDKPGHDAVPNRSDDDRGELAIGFGSSQDRTPFSSAGHLAVALVIATGIVNTVLVLQRWPTDFTSTYQMLLAAKIALVAGMTGLALTNRYIFVPRMLTQRDRAIIRICNGTYAELALGVGVLALVAFLGILDPA